MHQLVRRQQDNRSALQMQVDAVLEADGTRHVQPLRHHQVAATQLVQGRYGLFERHGIERAAVRHGTKVLDINGIVGNLHRRRCGLGIHPSRHCQREKKQESFHLSNHHFGKDNTSGRNSQTAFFSYLCKDDETQTTSFFPHGGCPGPAGGDRMVVSGESSAHGASRATGTAAGQAGGIPRNPRRAAVQTFLRGALIPSSSLKTGMEDDA